MFKCSLDSYNQQESKDTFKKNLDETNDGKQKGESNLGAGSQPLTS